MRYIIIFISTILLLVSCDPRSAKELYQSGGFTFPVSVVNPKDTIRLGDSVCFVFQIPDTIVLNGSKLKPFYGAKDGASFPVDYCEIDTGYNGGFRSFSPNLKVYATPGNAQGGVNLAVVNAHTLYTKYYLIPQRKGVYFLELGQAGYFDANNGGVKASVIYTLDVPNKNHQLLIASTLPRHNMAAYLQSRTSLGMEVYAFAVK